MSHFHFLWHLTVQTHAHVHLCSYMYAHLHTYVQWSNGNADISVCLDLTSEKFWFCFHECIGMAFGQIQVIFNCVSENTFCSDAGKECPANG